MVLILGAGINGCSVARELALNGVNVWIVDTSDIAFGATSRASRLIHGGLRYLEYADFHLVRESLTERRRLCWLAPHLVEPLRLYIPVAQRTSGLSQSAFRFLGVARSQFLDRITRPLRSPSERGLWTIEIGLSLYDLFAADATTPRHSLHNVGEPNVPRVDSNRYRWLCGYSDAQMRFPERYCVALLHDAHMLAKEMEAELKVLTYARAEFADRAVRVVSDAREAMSCTPAIVINATGAWGDRTLNQLHVSAPRLFGGTKGSHFVTHQAALKQAIGGSGLYAEAADGRLIFVLPFGDAVLVGTTDERFEESPERAVASDEELGYLISTVNELFPEVRLGRPDVTLTYSGVRPLPYVESGAEGAISRDHSIAEQTHEGIPVLTLVGGKLTTSRIFGERVADMVFERLGVHRIAGTAERVVPGGERIPPDRSQLVSQWAEVAKQFGFGVEQVRAMWMLCGSQVTEILAQRVTDGDPERKKNVCGTPLPRTFVRWVIDHEWVARIEDLVERRLMSIYEPGLSRGTLIELADMLVEAGRLDPAAKNEAVERAARRIETAYGRALTPNADGPKT
jgi:glycerol-3-phosphate dehydrogenase